MNELQQAFYEVMYKYHKSFSERGVRANLEAWKKAKKPLIELLRRHPNWNEQAMAVVFDYAEGRGIDPDVVDEISFTLTEMANEVIPLAQQRDFQAALLAATSDYSCTLSEDRLEIIRARGGVKCESGQKASRIIGRLCKKFAVDKHPRYNAVFAQMADALNPLQVQKTAVLSVHPCDFLEMSNKDDTWKSCHNLYDGGYQAGCLSYMTDSVSMIFFTVDETVKNDYHKAPRRSRQMFFYGDGQLFQSRLYPDSNDDLMEQHRALVQRTIASCLGAPNRWTLKIKREELNKCYESVEGSRQYPDYAYYGNLSVLKGSDPVKKLQIGSAALCVCCGNPSSAKGSLKCGCEEVVVCQDCGKTVPLNNARYLDNAFHCNACLHVCAACGKITHDTMFPAYDRRGNMVEVCVDCYQAMIAPCATCSVQNACGTIGGMLCPRTVLGAA